MFNWVLYQIQVKDWVLRNNLRSRLGIGSSPVCGKWWDGNRRMNIGLLLNNQYGRRVKYMRNRQSESTGPSDELPLLDCVLFVSLLFLSSPPPRIPYGHCRWKLSLSSVELFPLEYSVYCSSGQILRLAFPLNGCR